MNIQGDVGEILTSSELRSLGLKVIRNVYIPKDVRYTEIDIIGVSNIGIFVIENKNYNGVVYGTKSSKYWLADYGFYGQSYFLNPIIQNSMHKNSVIKLLRRNGYSNIPVFQPVIFNDKVNLNTKDTDKYVFTLSDFVKAYTSVTVSNLDDSLVMELSSLFSRYSDMSDEMKKIHVSLLKEV